MVVLQEIHGGNVATSQSADSLFQALLHHHEKGTLTGPGDMRLGMT